MRLRWATAAVLAVGLVFAPAAPAETTIVDLNDLPGGAGFSPAAINNSGQVVGAAPIGAPYPYRAFLYSGGVFTDLGTANTNGGVPFEEQLSAASDISDAGDVVGNTITNKRNGMAPDLTHYNGEIFREFGGTMTALGTLGQGASLDDPCYHYTLYDDDPEDQVPPQRYYFNISDSGLIATAYILSDAAVNTVGQVSGSYTEHCVGEGAGDTGHANSRGFIWSGGMTDLGVLGQGGSPGQPCYATLTRGDDPETPADEHRVFNGNYCDTLPADINDSGEVVGNSWVSLDPVREHAFIYDGGIQDLLNTPSGKNSAAFGINNSGTVIGWEQDFGALVFDNGQTTQAPLGAFGYRGINNDGDMLGELDPVFGGLVVDSHYLYLDRADEVFHLNSVLPPGSGWANLRAVALNDSLDENLQIVGFGQHFGQPDENNRAFLLSIDLAEPPDTTIDDGPEEGSTIFDSTPAFAFSSPDFDLQGFDCRLDSADEGDFAPCDSPDVVGPLVDGEHTFEVRAEDVYLHRDPSPASRTFTVDADPDLDHDGDGVLSGSDNCPDTPNPDQENQDGDGEGDACDADVDGDGVDDGPDNCDLTPNPGQVDTDEDGEGDACDADDDGDGFDDGDDNCPTTANPGQEDADGDGVGDVCEIADFNGDGFADLAVGTPDEDVGSVADAGVVQVVYGSASGLAAGGVGHFTQSAAGGVVETGDRFGAAVARGDFNNDGFTDLAVGAPDEDSGSTADVGVVNVMYGGGSGIDASGNRQFTQASGGGAAEAGDRFGAALAAGDFDGDLAADLGAGAPAEGVGSAAGAGALSVLYGGGGGIDASGNALFTQSGAAGAVEAGDGFGGALAAGNFDADAFTDLAAGAPDEDAGSVSNAGVVHVLYGGGSGIDASGNSQFSQLASGSGTETGDRFGAALAAGDFDGDLVADLGAGAPGEDVSAIAEAGALSVLYGGGGSGIDSSGNGLLTQSSAGGVREAGDAFGAALGAGNFDGDGFTDLAVGAPAEDSGSTADVGVVNVLYGGGGGIDASGNSQFTQAATGSGAEAGDLFGAALAAGDFNGDQASDLGAGAPSEDVSSITGAGALSVLYGGGSGIDASGNSLFTQSVLGTDLSESGDSFAFALG